MKFMEKGFEKLALKVSRVVGSPYWFVFSLLMVLIWAPSGFVIGFNEIWHLIINTSTTILTFLMMALLHSSQSKWEKQMDQMQMKQERILKLVEKRTEELIQDIRPGND